MTENEFVVLDKIQETVKECTKKPELYLSVQESIAQSLKNATKDLYDIAFKKKSHKSTKSQALPELIVEGFDAEQIWQQLELENNEEFSRIVIEKLSKTLANKNWELPLRTSALSENENEDKGEESESESEMSQNEFDDEDKISDDDDDSEEKIQKEIPKKKSNKMKRTEVDDKFFKIEELNRFLKMEDLKESGHKKEVDSDDEDLESIDLFNDIPDEESEDGEDDEMKNGHSLKYADFFDQPESDDEGEQGTTVNNMDIDADHGDDDEIDDEEDGGDDNEYTNNKNPHPLFEQSDSDGESGQNQKIKSSLEKRKERLEQRIHQLEDQAVGEKPWQLKGEVSSKDRPLNSMLEEFVEFDQVTRPAPIMTEQTTLKLEDIIRNRIKDKAWDDVEKKVKPVETPMEYKKKLIMNQEKSKESLAQIYENEYVKQREALTTDGKEEEQQEDPPEHNEIKELMHSLFIKLDALSNFHYTPKPSKPEIKIVSNVPAISMEEVAPVATSDAALLAPEEIQAKQKGDLIGKSERTKTDMKRARRKKKLKQHARALNESKKTVEGVKQKKSLKDKTKKLKGRNIIDMDDTASGKTIKSSTAFFNQLQDQVSSSIKSKTSSTAKKNKNTLSAVKLKL